MPIGGPLNVCNTCPVKHYDNCPQCFGFGIRAQKLETGGYAPITAAEAISGERDADLWYIRMETRPLIADDWRPCPNCRSTPSGIPTL